MREVTVYEVKFQEHGNPRGPDYRWFSKIGHALEFMNAIPTEIHVVEMAFKAHTLEEGEAGIALFLNRLTSDGAIDQQDDIPF
jgi:hypothetical protein